MLLPVPTEARAEILTRRDGAGANARFNFPHGVAVDPVTGNLYVTDTGLGLEFPTTGCLPVFDTPGRLIRYCKRDFMGSDRAALLSSCGRALLGANKPRLGRGNPYLEMMPQDPHAEFDHSVMDMIEHSPTGAMPHTTSYVEALGRLYATHQVYPSADHKGGHVTARSLSKLPSFHADNLEALQAGQIEAFALEANDRIFDRYVQSLADARRSQAESYRLKATGKLVHHRKHHGAEVAAVHRDPVHSLFLVPGSGRHPGLPGSYLYGSFSQKSADPAGGWAVQVHDSDDDASVFDALTLTEALAKVRELVESAPFDLRELEFFGFRAT